eukprot:857868-Karenia_brevis.AAC.1
MALRLSWGVMRLLDRRLLQLQVWSSAAQHFPYEEGGSSASSAMAAAPAAKAAPKARQVRQPRLPHLAKQL